MICVKISIFVNDLAAFKSQSDVILANSFDADVLVKKWGSDPITFGTEIKTMKFNNDYHFEVGIIDMKELSDGF